MQYGDYRAYLMAMIAFLVGPLEARAAVETRHQTPAPYMNAEIVNGVVNLKAHGITVQKLVEEITHRGGIRLILKKPLDERVTLEFYRLSLRQALGRILRGQNYALQCRQPLCSAADTGESVQGTLWVFSDGMQPNGAIPDDTNDRPAAVLHPSDSDSDQSALALASALDDPDASVREEAVDVLGGLDSEIAIPLLKRALLDPDSQVREAAIAGLADIGGEEVAQALATALDDGDASLREQAVDALGDIGGKAAARLLQQALADRENVVREAAAENLDELSDQR